MSLLCKIKDHSAVVAIIGAGYVGLPLAIELSKNNKVILYDIDEERISLIKSGRSFIVDIQNIDIDRAIRSNNLFPTSDESMLYNADCFIICVQTPVNNNKQPELTHVISASQLVAKYLKRFDLVILESTTFPGTTNEIVKPLLEKQGMKCGVDFFLAFSPERVDPGNKAYSTSNTPKIVGGVCAISAELARSLYQLNLSCDVFTVSSPAVAEMSKILENTYRNINIGFIDEFAQICHKLQIDVWEVIDAASTKPFGFSAFFPGPGIGGHCIPLDPYYLAWKSKEKGITATMIETSAKIIEGMPEYIVSRIGDILNGNNLPISGSRILIIGIAYKADVSDCRESPALRIMKKLSDKNAKVSYYDPYIDTVNIDGQLYKSVLEYETKTGKWDLIAIITGHNNIRYDAIAETGVPIFDTRNVYKGKRSNNIIKL